MLVKRLVEQMGGAIDVESTFGVGSVFWFELNTVDLPAVDNEESNVAIVEQHNLSRGERPQALL